MIKAFAYRKDTGEGSNILDFNTIDDLRAHAEGDHVFNLIGLTQPGFEHLHTCHAPPHHHRVIDGTLRCKERIEITADKYNFNIGGEDAAHITWSAPRPVTLAINAQRTEDRHDNEVDIVASEAGQFAVEIDDVDFFSNQIIVNAEELMPGENDDGED